MKHWGQKDLFEQKQIFGMHILQKEPETTSENIDIPCQAHNKMKKIKNHS